MMINQSDPFQRSDTARQMFLSWAAAGAEPQPVTRSQEPSKESLVWEPGTEVLEPSPTAFPGAHEQEATSRSQNKK